MENFDKKIVEFMINEENRDDIEYVYLYSIGRKSVEKHCEVF